MNKVNFLKREYRTELSRTEEEAGIVDGESNRYAYSTLDKNLKWNATIHNPNKHEFVFVPIDNNIPIYQEDERNMGSRCDGMLLVDELRYIAFIELKDVRSGGFSEGIKQLRSTITAFIQNHHVEDFRVRRAYVANIAHPRFQYSMKDQIESFRSLMFVLRLETHIAI